MASIYKKNITALDSATGQRRKRRSKKWWIKYRDGLGRIRRVSGSTDRSVALQLAAKLEKKAELTRAGVVDEFDEYRIIPLADQLNEYRDYLRNRGRTDKQVHQVVQRAARLLTNANFVFIGDVKISRVTRTLAELRSAGSSPQTCNHYLQALKQFFNWLVQERRWSSNPIAAMEKYNVEVDRRRVRRAASIEELNRVLSACQVRGHDRESGLSGEARVALYYLAAYSGLRRGELASLTRRSFNLEATPPTVTIAALDSKHRKLDRLPLHPALAEHLVQYLGTVPELTDKAPIFDVANVRTSEMLQRDLEAAEIPYQDADGAYLDFHALRHSFVSNLARVETNPKRTQSLARHGTMDLTMMVYAHSELADQAEAINKMPKLVIGGAITPSGGTGSSRPTPPPAKEQEEEHSGALPGAQLLARDGTAVESVGTEDTPVYATFSTWQTSANSIDTNDVGTDWHALALSAQELVQVGLEIHPRGLEPLTFGSVDRCSIQLS